MIYVIFITIYKIYIELYKESSKKRLITIS